jgi:hypothetical protein
MLLAAGLAGCGSGPATTNGITAQPTQGVPTTQPTQGGASLNAQQLCAVFTELAVGVLGGPVDQPTFGDVLPRPNGIYCHYQLTGNANTNVEVQLKQMPRSEAESLADTIGVDIPVAGLGEFAFRRDTAITGGAGVTLLAWSHDVGLTVVVNREGADQALMNLAAEGIARAVLAAAP